MKKTIRTYINTILLFLIPFVVISFILAILSYFMQTNFTCYECDYSNHFYALLILAALYFTSSITQKRLSHCLCFTLIYFLLSLLMHLGNINYLHLFLKIIIIYGYWFI